MPVHIAIVGAILLVLVVSCSATSVREPADSLRPPPSVDAGWDESDAGDAPTTEGLELTSTEREAVALLTEGCSGSDMPSRAIADVVPDFEHLQSLFLLSGRVVAAGGMIEVEGDRRSYYNVVIIRFDEVLIGDEALIFSGFRQSFPVAISVGFETPDSAGHSAPRPESGLCERLEEELLFVANLPDDHSAAMDSGAGQLPAALGRVFGTSLGPRLFAFENPVVQEEVVEAIRAIRGHQ